MEETLNIKIDTKELTDKIIEDSSLKDDIEREIRLRIVNEVASEIKNSLNLGELRERNLYSKDYLTRTAREILDKELRSLVEEYTRAFLKNIKWQVKRIVDDEIEATALPKIRRFVNNIVILDGEREKEFAEEQQAEHEASQDN